VWLFLVLPSRRRQKQHQSMQDSVEVGDEIITAGGIHGTVQETAVEDIRLEISPGVVVTLDRRAIAAVAQDVEVDEPEPETELETEPDGEVDGAQEPDQAEGTLRG
jgi:preprotein translocase subunit YajC